MNAGKILITLCLSGCLVFSQVGHAQSKAPRDNSMASLSVGFLGAMPIQKGFTTTHTVGGGGQIKLRMPVSEKGQITAGMRGLSYFGKENPATSEKYKQRNVLQFLGGYRYNFNPEKEKAFYLEPQIGFAMVGTKSSLLKYETALGYYLSDQVDIGIWHQIGFENSRKTKIGAIGLMLNVSFNNLFPVIKN